MIEMTYLKELRDEEDKAIISFEGDVLDIYELRDYAKALNLVKGEVNEGYRHEFKTNGKNCRGNCNDESNCKSDEETYFTFDLDEFIEALSDTLNMVCDEDISDENAEDDKSELCDIVSDIIMEEEDLVNHPPHYTNSGMECILEMIMLYGFEETMSFCKLNAHKYRKRALDKGGRQDIDKSDWYMNTYKELLYAMEIDMTPLEYILSKTN